MFPRYLVISAVIFANSSDRPFRIFVESAIAIEALTMSCALAATSVMVLLDSTVALFCSVVEFSIVLLDS